MRKTISLVLAVLMMLVLLPAVKLSPAVAEDTVTYTKVTKMSDITDGKYLVVVDSKKLDGAYYTFNGTSSGSFNKVDVDIADNTITGDYAANEIEIAVVEGGYTLKNSAGKYLGAGNGSNTVVFSDDALVNGIAINSSNTFSISMTTDAARELKLNNSNDQPYFRYYKVSTTNSNYYLPALYKKVEGTTPQPTETATPEPTNTPEPTTPPAPEGLTAVLMTELPANGDKIVIHNTANNMALGEGEKVSTYYNEGVAITPDANGILSNVPETIVWDVTVTEDGYYRFSQEKGVLAAGSYSSTPYNEVNKDWTIETLGEGYMIGNVGREGYYLEWYSSRNYFSIYNRNIDTTPDLFTFRFFKVSDEVPPTPTTGDTIVLFTNDVHCGIRDGWGYAGVADLKKTLEAEGNEVILVDAGDHSQGGPIGSLTQGTAIIDIMNAVGYDLAIPGNHEFDYGMTQFLDVLAVRANYPYVSANFMDLTTNTPVFDAYKIIEANGKKIAFVGLSTPESITKSTPAYFMNEERTEYIYGFCQDDTGAGVYTAAQNAIDAAKAEGADYVIIVGHMGIDEQSQPWTAPEVIANTTGVNAFIDGHSHSVINKTVKDKNGNDVLHGQTGTKLANVGKLTIKADGTMTIEILPASEKVKDDPEVDAVIAAIEAEFNELLNSVVAHTDHVLTIKNPDTGARAVRSAETNLGDLCADAYRYMFDADVAFVNGGGVRADIAEGDITFQQVINVHPFGNTAVLAEVTGQQILDALEMGARVCPSENGGFLQVAGLTYEIHTYLDANVVIDDAKVWQGPAVVGGEYRVKNVKILNKTTGEYEPLDLAKKYTLASHNYMLKDMGDGFAMFGSNITILEDSGKLDNQVLIDYIQSMPEVDGKHVVTGYTDPKGEGRIKIVTEQPTPVFYGEDVDANDVAEYVDGKTLYRYDVKVKDIDQKLDVTSLQVYLAFDNSALKFVEARSALEGSTGINEADGLISFAWATTGDGIKLADDTVIMSVYFELVNPVPDGTKIDIVFAEGANGAATGFSFVDGDTVSEAAAIETVNGSLTFAAPEAIQFVGAEVLATDVAVIEGDRKLYRYDVTIANVPEGGLMINSAQIFLAYDAKLLTFVKADGIVDWTVGEKTGKVLAVWADETEFMVKNGDVVLSVYFEADAEANGKTVDIAFTTNTLDTFSAASVVYGGTVVELEAETVDGSITFPEIIWGDANCDGKVTAADAAMILRALVDLAELTEQGALNADVNCDNEVTAEDAAIILRYIVKLIDKLPVED